MKLILSTMLVLHLIIHVLLIPTPRSIHFTLSLLEINDTSWQATWTNSIEGSSSDPWVAGASRTPCRGSSWPILPGGLSHDTALPLGPGLSCMASVKPPVTYQAEGDCHCPSSRASAGPGPTQASLTHNHQAGDTAGNAQGPRPAPHSGSPRSTCWMPVPQGLRLARRPLPPVSQALQWPLQVIFNR